MAFSVINFVVNAMVRSALASVLFLFTHRHRHSCTMVTAWTPTFSYSFTPPHSFSRYNRIDGHAIGRHTTSALHITRNPIPPTASPSPSLSFDDDRQNRNHRRPAKRQNRQKHRGPSTTKKQKVRGMFRRAKEHERSGEYRLATNLLRKILVIDPFDSYSHLALARLESRRERSSVSSSVTAETRTKVAGGKALRGSGEGGGVVEVGVEGQ